jgi:hypothetical protein
MPTTFDPPDEIHFWKRPGDEFTEAVDFTGKLPSGTQLSTGSVSAVLLPDGTDATNDVLQDTTCAIDAGNSIAQFSVQGGVEETLYRIDLQVILDNADILNEDFYMQVV